MTDMGPKNKKNSKTKKPKQTGGDETNVKNLKREIQILLDAVNFNGDSQKQLSDYGPASEGIDLTQSGGKRKPRANKTTPRAKKGSKQKKRTKTKSRSRSRPQSRGRGPSHRRPGRPRNRSTSRGRSNSRRRSNSRTRRSNNRSRSRVSRPRPILRRVARAVSKNKTRGQHREDPLAKYREFVSYIQNDMNLKGGPLTNSFAAYFRDLAKKKKPDSTQDELNQEGKKFYADEKKAGRLEAIYEKIRKKLDDKRAERKKKEGRRKSITESS